MPRGAVPERKVNLVANLVRCLQEYKQIILVKLDNVSTGQIQKARAILRQPDTAGEMIVGKNTLILKAISWLTEAPAKGDANFEIRSQIKLNPTLVSLKDHIKLNVGLIFTNASYSKLRGLIESEIIEMQAKAGVLAPCNVSLPAGPTSLDAGKIDIFHKLNIPVKIAKGNIEIQKDFPIITKNEKVTEAAALMCRTLNLTPFKYTLEFTKVYLPSGQVIGEDIIAMSEDTILDAFKAGVMTLTGLSLGAGVPNQLSVPHMVSEAFKIFLALGLTTGYEFKELQNAKNASANAGPAKATGGAPVQEAKVEEVVEEEADVSLGGMFSD